MLALLALVAQLVVSFGHVHAPRASHVVSPVACRTLVQPPAERQCPPINGDTNDCAICWTISLAGSLVLPQPPEVALPVVARGTTLPDCACALVLEIRAAAFDARGPPPPVRT
jgi:hypothetical protein